ncbi:MAG: helix-turn-helix transcriptional regulator [Candidatus Gastranaerophilales bacterium]|nr:helix-turn-helix transcriptional regulator [Candidatus Gastranaerophilales bacterium]
MEKDKLKKQIAENLRVLRAKNRISQEVLAEASGTTQQYINQIENEKVNVSVFVLVKIADALKVSANDLIY